MEDKQLRTMTGIYENRLRDYLAAKGEGWTVEECERNEDGYCIEVHESAQLQHRVRGRDRFDALRRMMAELRIQLGSSRRRSRAAV